MRVSVIRKSHFNAAHRLHNKHWSDEKNIEVFGLCNSPNFHGHNYNLEVKLTGEIDKETGFLYDLKDLADLIKVEVEERFDHKNLNLDMDYFLDINPTTEYLCYVIWKILREKIDEKFDIHLRLWETERNSVEYPVQ